MPLDNAAPVYTDEQKALWDFMAEIVRKNPARDIFDALSDAFKHADPPHDIDTQRAGLLSRELDRLGAEHALP
jgi:hypothetical protein